MSSGTYTEPLNYATNFNVPLLIHIVVCSSGLKQRIMNNEKIFLVQMDYGYGKSDKSWLECTIHNDTIFFKRNKDGVHAWHCNAINVNDHRVLDLKPLS